MLIYLTDTVGLNAGIVGTLIMFSKFADGITDVFFGNLIDKTHTKLGKARPWMLWSQIGNCILLVAVFAIPESLGETAKYAYFFITYTLLNVFYRENGDRIHDQSDHRIEKGHRSPSCCPTAEL